MAWAAKRKDQAVPHTHGDPKVIGRASGNNTINFSPLQLFGAAAQHMQRLATYAFSLARCKPPDCFRPNCRPYEMRRNSRRLFAQTCFPSTIVRLFCGAVRSIFAAVVASEPTLIG